MYRSRLRFAGLMAGLCVLFCTCVRANESDDCGATRYDCAVYYVEHQKFDLAVQFLERELQQSPQNLKALNLMGIALTGAGHPASANEKFREAIKISPHFYPARKNLAVNEFNADRQTEAESHFNRVLQDSPDDAISHIYLGEINFRKKQYGAALAHYDKGGPRTVQNPVCLLHSPECMLQTKDRERAGKILQEIPANDADDRFQAGLILGNSGAFADAAEFFGSIRNTYKDPYIAGYNQVLMLIRAGSAREAVQTADALFEEGFKRAELYNLISEAFLKLGRLQDAYDALRTATRLEPEN